MAPEQPIRRYGKNERRTTNFRSVPTSGPPLAGTPPTEISIPRPSNEVTFNGLVYTQDMVWDEPDYARQTAATYKETIPHLREEYQERRNDFKESYREDKLKFGAPTIETLEVGKDVVALDRKITETENFVDAIMEWLERMD